MLELPEALTIADQINAAVAGRRIANVTAAHTPHKFAWYHGDPQNYPGLLVGETIDKAFGYGGMVELHAGNAVLLFGDGAAPRFREESEGRPQKHQLLIEFEDLCSLSASIQMYGGIWCFRQGEYDNVYYRVAKEKPSPLSEKFDWNYFDRLISAPGAEKLSAKAFLATEQRIPGLGNGVLQDILYNSGIHPKRKIAALSGDDREALFRSVKSTLAEMTFQGGRDTEKDLFGRPGGYKTKAGKNTSGLACPVCGSIIKKENYLGGSIYFCEGCQAVG